jgi:hypothetical protein
MSQSFRPYKHAPIPQGTKPLSAHTTRTTMMPTQVPTMKQQGIKQQAPPCNRASNYNIHNTQYNAISPHHMTAQYHTMTTCASAAQHNTRQKVQSYSACHTPQSHTLQTSINHQVAPSPKQMSKTPQDIQAMSNIKTPNYTSNSAQASRYGTPTFQHGIKAKYAQNTNTPNQNTSLLQQSVIPNQQAVSSSKKRTLSEEPRQSTNTQKEASLSQAPSPLIRRSSSQDQPLQQKTTTTRQDSVQNKSPIESQYFSKGNSIPISNNKQSFASHYQVPKEYKIDNSHCSTVSTHKQEQRSKQAPPLQQETQRQSNQKKPVAQDSFQTRIPNHSQQQPRYAIQGTIQQQQSNFYQRLKPHLLDVHYECVDDFPSVEFELHPWLYDVPVIVDNLPAQGSRKKAYAKDRALRLVNEYYSNFSNIPKQSHFLSSTRMPMTRLNDPNFSMCSKNDTDIMLGQRFVKSHRYTSLGPRFSIHEGFQDGDKINANDVQNYLQLRESLEKQVRALKQSKQST